MSKIRALKNLLRRQNENCVADLRVLSKRINGSPVLRQVEVNGFRLLVRTDEHVGRFLYYQGHYDPDETAYLPGQLRPEDTCVDIGAHAGYYTLLMAANAKEVHSFEPVPLSFHLLNTNLSANDMLNVRAHCSAISDCNGWADFTVSRDSAYSSFQATGIKETRKVIRVETVTLDNYLAGHPVNILKIDVEGAEAKVLCGAHRTLSLRPRLIMIELADQVLSVYRSSVEEVTQLICSYDYQPYIVRRGELRRLNLAHYDQSGNVFFMYP
jgi:FkbM family methyltransferase